MKKFKIKYFAKILLPILVLRLLCRTFKLIFNWSIFYILKMIFQLANRYYFFTTFILYLTQFWINFSFEVYRTLMTTREGKNIKIFSVFATK